MEQFKIPKQKPLPVITHGIPESELEEFLTDNTEQLKLQKKSQPTKHGLPAKYKHDEVIPFFVDTEELFPLYQGSDLSFAYVYDKCVVLSGLKGIPISREQAGLWYIEMLRDKWTMRKFDEQYNAIKLSKVFGAIDWAQWNESIEMIPAQTVRDRAIAEVNRYADGIRHQTQVLRSQIDHVTVNRAAIALEELRQARMELSEAISRKEESISFLLRKEADEYFQKVKQSGDISEIEMEFPEVSPDIIRGNLRQFCNIYFYKKQSQ